MSFLLRSTLRRFSLRRREFLAASLSALPASAANLPASAANLPASAAADVRVGFIGLGGRGNALLQEARTVPGLRVTHLCDVDQARLERAKASAEKLGFAGPQTSTDLRRVLSDQAVDAVVIATPDHWHAPAALLACEAGKDVYVEKPVSHNYREGRLLVQAARRYGRIVQGGLQARSRPIIQKSIALAHSGRLGRLLMAKAWNTQLRDDIGHKSPSPVPPGIDYDLWVGPAEMVPFNENHFHYKWHWHWNFGTGDLGNDGAHQLDIARWALGAKLPRRVFGMGAKYFFKDDQQTPDTMNLTFDYGDQALQWEMRIWHDYGLEGIDNGVAVYGTDGYLHIGRWNRKWGYRLFEKGGKLVEELQDTAPEAHLQNFLSCVVSRQAPNCEIEIGHLSTGHCHLGNIVHRTGRNLTFDPAREVIVGDAEANAMLRRRYRKHWATPKESY